VALPGALGLIFLLPFSYGRRMIPHYEDSFTTSEIAPESTSSPQEQEQNRTEFEKTRKRDLSRLRRDFLIQYFVLMIIWGAIAIAYNSVLIGFFTVGAAMVVMGLSPFVPIVVQGIGFEQHDWGATTLVISFVLVMVFLAAEVLNMGGVYAAVFKPGVFWIGADVYFGALAVLATRYYHRDNFPRFLLWQFISIASGVGALFIGAFWNISVIQEIGGTYLLIYVLEKYIESFNWRRGWAWALLGLGLLLYGMALLINTYPQFFLLG
jgi:hypothetical protein